jgi:hypothetical protein
VHQAVTSNPDVNESAELGHPLHKSLNLLAHRQRLDNLARWNIEGATFLPHDLLPLDELL